MEQEQLEVAIAKLPNRNRPSDYRWLEALLSMIALHTAPTVTDLTTRATGAPLFVMAGACPSVFAGMQAVVFTAMQPGAGGAPPPGAPPLVDYWWLKPRAGDAAALEDETLNRHGKGAHKNDPGASKKVYGPIASFFLKGSSPDGKLRFGITPGGDGGGGGGGGAAAGATRPRAYIECADSGARYVLVWVWLEDWSSPVSFGKKFMKGKLVYQKSAAPSADAAAGSGGFFARPFKFVDGLLMVPPGASREEAVAAVVPGDQIKIGCDI